MVNIALPPKATFPEAAYYSTQPFIAWCLNEYAYSGNHYVWCSKYFFPYQTANPKSSSPYQIYQDLYQPACDRDQFDSFIRQKRLNLRVGVDQVVQSQGSTHPLAARYHDLCKICDRVDVSFFWPLIYLIKEKAVTDRGQIFNSALVGSEELLVTDLKVDEFTLVQCDLNRKSPVANDFVVFLNGDVAKTDDPIDRLLKRC